MVTARDWTLGSCRWPDRHNKMLQWDVTTTAVLQQLGCYNQAVTMTDLLQLQCYNSWGVTTKLLQWLMHYNCSVTTAGMLQPSCYNG